MNMVTRIVLYIFAFVLMYFVNIPLMSNPYLFPIFCFVLLLFMELFSKRLRTVRDVIPKKVSHRFIIGITISAIYCALICLIKNEDLSLSDTRIVQNMMFLIYFGIVVIFVKYLGLFYDTPEKKMTLLFRVACIQGIICLLMLLFPQLKSIANDLFISESGFVEGDYILSSRIYGISSSYTYGLPILHGLLSGICFYYGAVKNKKFFLYFPLIFIVALLNGRTGVIIGILSVLIVMIYLAFKSRYRKKFIVLFIAVAVILVFSFILLEKLAPNVYSFIMIAFDEMHSFIFNGELGGTSQYLLQDRLFLPEGVDLIFGSGTRVYGIHEYGMLSSDIGFVNDVFTGGLIYAGILYYSYFRLTMSCFNNKDLKFVRFLILLTLLIANWKGEIFKNATFIIGLFFVLIVNANIIAGKDKENVQ